MKKLLMVIIMVLVVGSTFADDNLQKVNPCTDLTVSRDAEIWFYKMKLTDQELLKFYDHNEFKSIMELFRLNDLFKLDISIYYKDGEIIYVVMPQYVDDFNPKKYGLI